jgi:hypothetical protein
MLCVPTSNSWLMIASKAAVLARAGVNSPRFIARNNLKQWV